MLKVAICDDEQEYTVQIENAIMEASAQNGIKTEVSVFYDGYNLVEYMKQNDARFDLIFLDIEMEKLDGIKAAKQIREFDEMVYLIYVTSHKNYAIEAYEVQPFQFVVKPFTDDIIKKYFMNIYERINREDFFFEYKQGMNYYKVPVKDILYFRSERRVIHIHMKDGSVMDFYDKLGKVEEKLLNTKMDFWRIHRSYLVNARYIKEKAYDHVTLFNGEILMISEDRRKNMNIQYAKMVEQNMM